MRWLNQLVRNEPTLIISIVRMLILLGVSYGLGTSEEQMLLIIGVVELILLAVNRAQVTPTGKFDAAVNQEAANIAEAALDAPTWGDLEQELDELEQRARLKEASDGNAQD
jgi:hypothetical protein